MDEKSSMVARTVIGTVVLLQVLPVLAVALNGVATDWAGSLLPEGLTLHWIKTMAADPRFLQSVEHSLIISIATLVLTRPSAVLFTLPARALDDIRAAMARGPVEVIAFDQDNRHTLATGTLLLVDNTIDQTTATIRLKAMFPNEDDKLWPGEFVNARVLLETRSNAVVVPSAAVQRGPNGLFVWAVSGKDIAEPRPIETAQSYDNLTIVTSGLSGGERVVTDGQYRLQRNAPVTYTSPQVAGSAGNS